MSRAEAQRDGAARAESALGDLARAGAEFARRGDAQVRCRERREDDARTMKRARTTRRDATRMPWTEIDNARVVVMTTS